MVIELVLENGSDVVYVVLFWFVVVGVLGVVLYCLSNILDVMWGYCNVCFECFGWVVVKIDDIFNYLLVWLVVLIYVLFGDIC